MTKPASNTSKPIADRTETVILPDVTTEAHPIVTIPAEPAIEEDTPAPAVSASEDAPVGDYVRQIQLEFEEQEDEGKLLSD